MKFQVTLKQPEGVVGLQAVPAADVVFSITAPTPELAQSKAQDMANRMSARTSGNPAIQFSVKEVS